MRTLVILICAGLQLPAWAANSLAPAIESLARAAGDLDRGVAKERSPAIAEKGQKIQKTIEKAWADAVSVELEIAEGKLKDLGVVPKLDSSDYIYEVHYTETGENLKKRALRFDPTGWSEIVVESDRAVAAAQEGDAMIKQARYTDGISREKVANLTIRFSKHKIKALQTIRSRADKTLHCIEHVSSQMEKLGLKVSGNEGNLYWSQPELQREYGVLRLEDLRDSQRETAANRINQILDLPPDELTYCVSDEMMDFLNQQQEMLRGKK